LGITAAMTQVPVPVTICSKNKSLPKETFRKSIDGEGHGAVAGNASAKNLNRNGSERLNRFALTQSYSAAKLQQNTETTKKKVQNLINNGYILNREPC